MESSPRCLGHEGRSFKRLALVEEPIHTGARIIPWPWNDYSMTLEWLFQGHGIIKTAGCVSCLPYMRTAIKSIERACHVLLTAPVRCLTERRRRIRGLSGISDIPKYGVAKTRCLSVPLMPACPVDACLSRDNPKCCVAKTRNDRLVFVGHQYN